MTTNGDAAGAHPPAALHPGTWVEWRERQDAPLYSVALWPHRALGRSGKRTVMIIAALGFAMPLVPAFGTPVFWGLLPFEAAALGFLWLGFRRSDADGRLTEVLTLWRDEMRVERTEPSGRVLRWQAKPSFVRLGLRADGGKVENYLTLRGGGREIELGAFLSPDERLRLHDEITQALTRAR